MSMFRRFLLDKSSTILTFLVNTIFLAFSNCLLITNCIISVDCLWTDFQYTECSNPCGGGTSVGTRSILRRANYGGKECTGPSEVTSQCNSDPEGGMTFYL